MGGGVLNQIPEQGVVRNLSTNFALPLSGSFCITDSLSHTTYVETNHHCPVPVKELQNGKSGPIGEWQHSQQSGQFH